MTYHAPRLLKQYTLLSPVSEMKHTVQETQTHSHCSRHGPTAPATVPLLPSQSHCSRHSPTSPVTVPLLPSQSHFSRHNPIASVTVPPLPSQSHYSRHGPTSPVTAPLLPSQHPLLSAISKCTVSTPDTGCRASPTWRAAPRSLPAGGLLFTHQ